ncbi:MAG: hypothetical protein ACLFO2_01445 [Candidatus Woesearchaeota archaeon]
MTAAARRIVPEPAAVQRTTQVLKAAAKAPQEEEASKDLKKDSQEEPTLEGPAAGRAAEPRPDPLGKEASVVGAPTVVREEKASKELQGVPEPPAGKAAAEAPQEEEASKDLKKDSQESAKRALAASHHYCLYGES